MCKNENDRLKIQIESAIDDHSEYFTEFFDLLGCKVLLDKSGQNINLNFMESSVNFGFDQLIRNIDQVFKDNQG